MSKFKKSTTILTVTLLLAALVLPNFAADENYIPNMPSDSNMNIMMEMSMLDSIELPFDPNYYHFLIYNPGGSQASIKAAMTKLGIPYDLRGDVNGIMVEVTPNDLQTHDILIVGWNYYGNTTGLHSDDLLAGITGRIILSGHDLDYHTVWSEGDIQQAAQTMLIQSINYVLQGGGTGLITLGDVPNSGVPFSYLPKQTWDVNAIVEYYYGEDVNSFTLEGLASGVFDGLEPNKMCNWDTSYHDTFTIGPSSVFVPFELGGNDGNDIITIARTMPATDVNLTKTDDVSGCIVPSTQSSSTYINYTIHLTAHQDVNTVKIVDLFSDFTDFNSCSAGGTYNEPNHTVTWNLGNIHTNDSNTFTLRVKVSEDAPQGNYLTNRVKMYSGDMLIKTATEQTKVCCLDNKVFVDPCAPPGGHGSSWQDAFKELRDALVNVRDGNCGCADTIFVAKGTYKPTDNVSNTDACFAMVNGVDLYGHFHGGWETSIAQRNMADDNCISTLSGDINSDGTSDVTVVTAANSKIDGFTVKKGSNRAISCSACSPTISNCVIKDSNDSAGYYGVYCEGGANVTLTNTFINNNRISGICGYGSGTSINIDHCTIGPGHLNPGLYTYNNCLTNATVSVFNGNNHYGISATSSSRLTLENCDISDNTSQGGINFAGATADIRRCTIQRNNGYGLFNGGGDVNIASNIISNNNNIGVYVSGGSNRITDNLIHSNNSYGVYVSGCDAKIRNNTIVRNNNYGIYRYFNYSGNILDINSSIIWNNTNGGISGLDPIDSNKVNYNCIQGGYAGNGNISSDPCFVNKDVNDFHLKNISPCIDKGSPYFADFNQTDIDGECRIMDGNSDGTFRVDIGSDEFNPYDLTGEDGPPDHFVNFLDFSVIGRTWGKSVGQGGYDDRCDFYNDNVIDYRDLFLFCEYWLTPADWQGVGGEGAYFEDKGSEIEMMKSMQGESMIETAAESIIEHETVDIEKLVNWLDEVWLGGDLKETMTEDEYQEFRKAIEQSQ